MRIHLIPIIMFLFIGSGCRQSNIPESKLVREIKASTKDRASAPLLGPMFFSESNGVLSLNIDSFVDVSEGGGNQNVRLGNGLILEVQSQAPREWSLKDNDVDSSTRITFYRQKQEIWEQQLQLFTLGGVIYTKDMFPAFFCGIALGGESGSCFIALEASTGKEVRRVPVENFFASQSYSSPDFKYIIQNNTPRRKPDLEFFVFDNLLDKYISIAEMDFDSGKNFYVNWIRIEKNIAIIAIRNGGIRSTSDVHRLIFYDLSKQKIIFTHERHYAWYSLFPSPYSFRDAAISANGDIIAIYVGDVIQVYQLFTRLPVEESNLMTTAEYYR